MEKFKVSSKTDSAKLAGAIAGAIRGGNEVEMQAVGAGLVNQAIKATAIARGFLSPSGIEIAVVPSFRDVQLHGEERTSIVLEVKKA